MKFRILPLLLVLILLGQPVLPASAANESARSEPTRAERALEQYAL